MYSRKFCLFQDHIQEVLNKWDQIDDEIWAKIICMERNRRVAKAYARASVITINGSDVGFDGYRIGLKGLENEYRESKTEEVKKLIGQGVKLKMDEMGNILIKRVGRSNVFVKGCSLLTKESTSIGSEIMKNNGRLEQDKAMKLFDMKKFQNNIEKEIGNSYPDRRKLENQCISAIAFVKDANDILDLPVWIMVINVVAIDMLKSKMPLSKVFLFLLLISISKRIINLTTSYHNHKSLKKL
ncbi:uncharacterized protein B4U79_05248 [Dinothrombium tinctorium]|uniref:MH2 domain-containing protein n=1 Tax=Dinothrombium tinctorium TaxID=1965070 RepID=A0A3S3P3M0_9ACAR|nr:uncharacterized protein B4U79_03895 [Dinothrombium tinctorium]RWS07398.1 uncharacterized protein B4U79_04301 [Dinothrombium tinctorium]RWS09816.1 uncharacterized protein B4U79_05248 [Dinothrombium tinctorium]